MTDNSFTINKNNINEVLEATKEILNKMGVDGKLSYQLNEDGTYTILFDNEPLPIGLGKNEPPRNKNIPKPTFIPNINYVIKDISEAIVTYKAFLNDLDEMGELSNVGYITGELRQYYNGLKDASGIKIALLNQYLNNVISVINYGVLMYIKKDTENKAELAEMIDGLFDATDFLYEGIGNINTLDDLDMNISENKVTEVEKLSITEFIDGFNMVDEVYEELYQNIAEEFVNKLNVAYFKFKCEEEPRLLNGIVESLYFSGSTINDKNSPKYNEGLKTFKEEFTNLVFGKYNHSTEDIEKSDIPLNIWENKETTDYDRAILLTVYNNFDGLYKSGVVDSDLYKFAENYKGENYRFKSLEALSIVGEVGEIINTENWFKQDIDLSGGNIKEKLNNIIREYETKMENIILNFAEKEKDLFTSYAFDDEEINIINESLIKNNYLKEGEEVPPYSEIFMEIYRKEGPQGIQNIFSSVDDSIDIAETFGKNSFLGDMIKHDIYDGFIKKYKASIDDLITKKLALDSSKANYRMSLASSLDVSKVNDEQYKEALKQLGDKAQYLEPWQIETYALTQNNEELKSLLNETYHNQVASRQGYNEALLQAKGMVGNNDSAILSVIRGAYTTGVGWYDGLLNSIKGVARLGTADGIISTDDYRQNYLQELLATDFSIYKDYYDTNSDNHENVVKMLSHNYSYESLKSFKDKNGNNLFTEEYINKAQEKNISYYELLYSKGLIDKEEYHIYSNLNERKDDGNKDIYLKLANNSLKKDIRKLEYNISNSIGNMTIPLVLSTFVNPWAGTIWTGLSVTGNEREALLVSGKQDDASTWMQAAAKGAIAACSEKLLGSIKGLGNKSDKLLDIFNSNNPLMQRFMSNKAGKLFARVLSNQVNETFSELAENVGNHVVDLIGNGELPTLKELSNETWQTIYMTFITTPLLNLMGGEMQKNDKSYGNRKIKTNINGVEFEYTRNELASFCNDNGDVDHEGFFKYLILKEKVSNYGDYYTIDGEDLTKSDFFKAYFVNSDYDSLTRSVDTYKKIIAKQDYRRDISTLDVIMYKIFDSINNGNGLNSDYEYYRNIAMLLSESSDIQNKLKNDEILKDRYNSIMEWIYVIEGKISEMNEKSFSNVPGLENILVKSDIKDREKLARALEYLRKANSELPDFLRRNRTEINLMDSNKPNKIIKSAINGKRGTITEGTFYPNDGKIEIYDYGLSQGYEQFFGVYAHEKAHSLDFGLLEGENVYWSEQNWKDAISADATSVSDYGDTDVTEDFAEMVKRYVLARAGYESMKELNHEFPNRMKLLRSIIKESR